MEKNCNTCKFAILSRNVTPCLNCDVDFCNWGSTDSVMSQEGEKLVALDCQVCGKEYMGEEPKGCCSGRDCACMGQPIEPMVCSSECWDRLMSRNRPQGEKREMSEKVTTCIGKNVTEIKIGDTVYHRSIYEHKEPLKVVGITENALLLEGDYSGGTHNVCQRDWLPLKGTSRVYNHAYKERARKDARTIEILAIPCAGNQDNTFKCMMDMVDAVLVLTSDVELNPEF